jgi:hypothetical protein
MSSLAEGYRTHEKASRKFGQKLRWRHCFNPSQFRIHAPWDDHETPIPNSSLLMTSLGAILLPLSTHATVTTHHHHFKKKKEVSPGTTTNKTSRRPPLSCQPKGVKPRREQPQQPPEGNIGRFFPSYFARSLHALTLKRKVVPRRREMRKG